MIFMKHKKLLIRIVAILFISIAFLFLIIVDPYKDLDENNEVALLGLNDKNFERISKKGLLKIFDKNTSVVYFGEINQKSYKVLNILSRNNSFKNKIYYIDIESEKRILTFENNSVKILKEGTEFYNSLLEKLGSFAEIYTLYNEYNEPINSGYKTIYTPMVIFVKEGKILFAHYINDENISEEELQNIYVEGFNKIN